MVHHVEPVVRNVVRDSERLRWPFACTRRDNMKKHAIVLAAVIALVTAGVAREVSAGSKIYLGTGVNMTSRAAWGSVGTVRNSTDTREAVGCWVDYFPTGPSAQCFITTPSNVTASCATSDPDMVAAIAALAGDTQFRIEWDASNQCSRFVLLVGSQIEPRVR